ncbi:MAG: sulfurtransferase DndC [Clostridiales bacterium 43-6]|nr:MAG: sulfurtransferase DndC [Clostridiales bacterium 43-6]
MGINKDDIRTLTEIVKNLYLSDDIPWVIGYSGGKDSTATLQLVWHALSEMKPEELKKSVHVISTDTLVESPVVAKWVEISLARMKTAAEIAELPIVSHRLIPDYKDTFWVNILGRGYPYPRPNFRWCTDRLKIQPANTFVQNVVAVHGEVIMVLGTRKAESANRAKTMAYYEKQRVREFLSPNSTMQNELIFSPLEDWTDDDVWTFLMQYKNPWGHSNKELLTMYRGATADGECPLVMNTDTPSCGKSRFGCWVCTMVEQDKSMAAMIMNDSEKAWMTPLLELRNHIGNAELDRERRDFRRMTGHIKAYKGRLVHGPYKKEVREEWLRSLLKIQADINRNGPAEFRELELITLGELKAIRRIWLDEKHEFDDSLPRIYEEITDKIYTDDTFTEGSAFGVEEWKLLRDVCSDLYPDEELVFQMMTRLVDVEKKSSDMKKRKGVLGNIETEISKCYYKNEEDALNFALIKNRRKKDMGGNFDEKAEILEDDIDLAYGGDA